MQRGGGAPSPPVRLPRRSSSVSRPGPHAEQVVLTRQELAILQQAVDELPPRCREVFVLARLEGPTYAQIGTRLGISPKTAFSHTVKALAHLHSRLEQARRI